MGTFFDDDFYDLFTLGFGKPRNIKFNTERTQDMSPAHWKETESGYKATCRTVGISEDDVNVELCDGFIKVSGESEYDGSKYNVSYELPVSDDVLANISKIEYKTLNGLTHVYLSVDRPEKKKLIAQKIK
jgi:HSP20 family molecular chaperone IbpA